ncbi:MAG TPA: polysaccharide biosynthesis C-terminal domain-containing protein [Saprospiraceae bacterium]|nr:polysaccharide biosynthesis C-terminal domain-containing protein [Saprospiraceae bacterium]
MSWTTRFQTFTADHVRMIQAYTLCRQSGIILGSIVIARVLPLDQVGILELLFLCGYLVTFFWSDAFLKGYLARKNELDLTASPSVFLLFCFLAGLLSMSLLFVGRHLLVPLFTNQDELNGLVLFGLYQAFVIPLWLAPYTGGLNRHNIILSSAFVLIGPAFACWVGHSSLPGINGILIGLLSYALVGFVWMLTQVKFSPDLKLSRLLIAIWPVTWPLILYAVSSTIAKSLDSWLVAHFFDANVFAVFRYGAREFPLVVSLAAGLSTVMIPRLFQNEALPELKLRSTRLMNRCYPIVAILMLFSPPLFAWVFGESFKASAIIFNIYLLLTLTQLIFPQTILTARGDTKLLWFVSILELIVNVVASLLLMIPFGLVGIVWGTWIAFAFEKIILLVLVSRKYQIPPSSIFSLRTLVMYTLILTVTFILSVWLFGI